MAGSQQRTYSNFSGGQNNHAGPQAGPVIIDKADGTEALLFAHSSVNWEMAEDGLLKYAGDDAVLASALSGTPVITGQYDWNGINIVCAGGKVFTIAGDTATQIYTGHTAGKYYQFTEWDDGAGTEILIMCNGTDIPLYYDGTTCTTISFTDDANPIWDDFRPQGAMVFRGSIFYWGDPTYPHRVKKARPGTHNNFDNTESSVESFDVDAGFGGYLTGMKALTDNIAIIYKQRAIRRMSGMNPFGSEIDPISLRPITDEYGCIAPRTIVQKGLDQYFLSEDGFRKLKPVQQYGDIEDMIPTYPIQGVMDGVNYTTAAIKNACAVYHKPSKQIWLSVPYGSNATNNKVIIHDTVTGGNDPRDTDDILASTLAVFDRKVYHGSYAGQVYKHGDDYSYHGSAVEATWESKWIAHNGVGPLKCYRELHIQCESDGQGSLVFQWRIMRRGEETAYSETQAINSGGGWDESNWDEMLWDAGGQQTFKVKNLGKGNAIKFRFINLSNNQRIKIRQVDLFYDVFSTARG